MRSSLPPLALLATVAAAAVTAAPAAAAPAVNGEFAVDGTPGHLALGPDGNVWVLVSGGDADIVKIAPDGTVTPFRDARLTGAVGITSGPGGKLWVTRTREVVSFTPADPGGSDEAIPVADLNEPRGIASDGRVLWLPGRETLVRIDAAGTVTTTSVAGMTGHGIAIGGDGRVLVADFDGARIASFDPAALDRPVFTDVGGNPQEVAGGAMGSATFAYTNPLANPQEVGVVTPPGAALRTQVPMTDPTGIALGDDSAWWIANFSGQNISRLSANGAVTPLSGFSPLSGPRWITRGSGGTLWVSLELARRVARVTGVEAPVTPPPPGGGGTTPPPGGGTTPPPARDTRAPTLRIRAPRGARAGAKALVVTATVDEASTLTATLRQRVAGKRRGSACVKPTRKLRRARGCVRLVVLGSARATAKGAGSVRLTLRRRDRRALAAGTYRVEVGARDAAGNRTTKTLTVILRRPRR